MNKEELAIRIPAEDHTPLEMALCRIVNPRKPQRLIHAQRLQIQNHGISMEEVRLVADWFNSQKHHKGQKVDYYCCRELKTLINKWVSQHEKAVTWAENDSRRFEHWFKYYHDLRDEGDTWAEEWEGDLIKHGLITLDRCRIFGREELKHDWMPGWEKQYNDMKNTETLDSNNTGGHK